MPVCAFLQSIRMIERFKSIWNEQWQPVSRWTLLGWSGFFSFFLLYAISNRGEGLLIDNANLVVHEAGHALFSWFGNLPGLCGGTALQLLVPLLLASYFFVQRQITGFAFCTFFFFENFLGIASYMADARSMALPLVTIGDPEFTIHDWNAIFGTLGLLEFDTQIAALVRVVGWIGMAATPIWLIFCTLPKRVLATSQNAKVLGS
jgi:hypothetical protein